LYIINAFILISFTTMLSDKKQQSITYIMYVFLQEFENIKFELYLYTVLSSADKDFFIKADIKNITQIFFFDYNIYYIHHTYSFLFN